MLEPDAKLLLPDKVPVPDKVPALFTLVEPTVSVRVGKESPDESALPESVSEPVPARMIGVDEERVEPPLLLKVTSVPAMVDGRFEGEPLTIRWPALLWMS